VVSFPQVSPQKILYTPLLCSALADWFPPCYMKIAPVVFPSQQPASGVSVVVVDATHVYQTETPYRLDQPLVSSTNFIRESYFRPPFFSLLYQRQPWTAGYAIPAHRIYTGCGRKNTPILEGHSFGWGACTVVGSTSSNSGVRAVFSVHMVWLGEHRAFIVEEFIQNGGSPVATQRAFRIRFALGRLEGCSW